MKKAKKTTPKNTGAQNLTLRLSKKTLGVAHRIARARGTSMSGLIVSLIEQAAEQNVAYDQAKNQALASLAAGFDLGTHGHRTVSREALHERR
jgi:uncharacterized protein (DUF1778 family)